MTIEDRIATQFELDRPRLRGIAYRMLGSLAEAEDAVQETWLRISRTVTGHVDNPAAWLTTVVSRVCLDMLRSRTARREDSLDADATDRLVVGSASHDPEQQAVLSDSVSLALILILETLEPDERLAFVLHDMFGVPFDEIGPLIGRTSTAARQLASRARRRVRGASPVSRTGLDRHRAIVEAFLTAAREGDMRGIVAVLDPDVVVRADERAVRYGTLAELRGPDAVAESFRGRAAAARLALVDGAPGAAWVSRDRVIVVFDITIVDDRITAIELVGEPDGIAAFELELEAVH